MKTTPLSEAYFVAFRGGLEQIQPILDEGVPGSQCSKRENDRSAGKGPFAEAIFVATAQYFVESPQKQLQNMRYQAPTKSQRRHDENCFRKTRINPQFVVANYLAEPGKNRFK